jgi:hypothetical protein
VGQLTADGLGPYDLPDATHADAQRDRDGFMHSSCLWTSENAWIPVRIHVSDDKVGKLVRQIGDARMRPDGSTIIEAPMFSVCPISLANLPRRALRDDSHPSDRLPLKSRIVGLGPRHRQPMNSAAALSGAILPSKHF